MMLKCPLHHLLAGSLSLQSLWDLDTQTLPFSWGLPCPSCFLFVFSKAKKQVRTCPGAAAPVQGLFGQVSEQNKNLCSCGGFSGLSVHPELFSNFLAEFWQQE